MFTSFKQASLNLLRQADQFGAVFKPSIKVKTQQYKTIEGGIISITLYGLSLAYFIYGIQQWATNQILPNIVDFKEVNDIITYQSPEKIISIESQVDDSQIDPFDKQNIILLVLRQQYENDWPSSNLTRIRELNGSYFVENLSIVIDNSDQKSQNKQESCIYVSPCEQQFLDEDEKCANQSVIEQYWNQSNYLLMRFHLQQYNTKTRQLTQLKKLYYISFSQDQTYINNLYLQQTKTVTDQGVLFPDLNYYNFISDISQQSQSISYQSGAKSFGAPSYICLYLTMDTLQLQQNVAFANIGNVLASIGSIISSLLFFSYVAILINQKSLEDDAIFDVIKMYYPEFKQIVVKKNWHGKYKSVQNQKTNLFYDVQEYKQYYNRLAQIAEQKLCMSNVIYELSRLQFAIQTLMSREDLIKIRDKHLQIALKCQQLKQKDLAKMKQPSFSQIVRNFLTKQPSNDRDSRIIQVHDLKEDELDQSVINYEAQYKQDNLYESEVDDFDILCLNRINTLK